MFNAIITVMGAAILGIFGWAFQLNSRVSVQETKHDDLKDLINTKMDALKDNIEFNYNSISARLDRIERAMNGALKGH